MVLDSLVNAVRTTGGIGVVGVYLPSDPNAATEGAQQGRIGFDEKFDKRVDGYTKVLLHPSAA